MGRRAIFGALLAMMATPAVAQVSREVMVEVMLTSPGIRLADLTVLPPELAELGARVVARIPAGADRVMLDQAAIETILRRQVPGRRLEPHRDGPVLFRVVDATATEQQFSSCSELTVPVSAGQYLDASMASNIRCDDARNIPQQLSFDRAAGTLRAAAAIPAGTYLGRTLLQSGTVTPQEATLLLRVRSGPVLIEREVVTLQPVRQGGQVFVRTPEGEVLSVRMEGQGQ